jgi:4'-phosphopantetheinyl transferase
MGLPPVDRIMSSSRNPAIPEDIWVLPPDTPKFQSDDVHVWLVRLGREATRLACFYETLTSDELSRAASHHFKKDRDHFVVTRGVLRAILGCYLGVDPGLLSFCYSSSGKPSLTLEFGGDWLRFNVSHSCQLALIAVAYSRDVGVDVEWLRTEAATSDIAEHNFSRGEISRLCLLPVEKQVEGFFNCWTRKEAYIKARGEGLCMPLDKFEVSVDPGEPPRLLRTDGDACEPFRWSMRSLDAGSGYAAAVVAEGQDWRLRCWRWPD